MARCEFLRWMLSTGRMDEGVVTSEKCWSVIEEKMPEISREVTWLRSGHVSMFSRRKFAKLNPTILMEEKSWSAWKSNPNIVMDEELVQNVAWGEKFVKNFVMDAKIDPKVVMDLFMLKIGGRNILQPSNRKLLEESIDEDEPWLLLIGSLSKYPLLMICSTWNDSS